MAQCKDCGSAFAFHELREERCLSCWHRLSTGNPLPANAKRELVHKVAMLEEELERVKAQNAHLRQTLSGAVKRIRIHLANLTGEPEPEFDTPAPSALELIHAVAKATADAGKEKR